VLRLSISAVTTSGEITRPGASKCVSLNGSPLGLPRAGSNRILCLAKTRISRFQRHFRHLVIRLCWAMITRLVRTIRIGVLLCGGSRALVLENLALRQQLGMYQRSRPKPAMRRTDRWFWVGLCRLWPGWATALVVLRPATVIG
jgi:hypothetical protein